MPLAQTELFIPKHNVPTGPDGLYSMTQKATISCSSKVRAENTTQ
jgi:hypothetical protein